VKAVLKTFKRDPSEAEEAVRRARATGCNMAAFGQVILVATLSGELLVYENTGGPEWL
jgi:hypothetical protein